MDTVFRIQCISVLLPTINKSPDQVDFLVDPIYLPIEASIMEKTGADKDDDVRSSRNKT